MKRLYLISVLMMALSLVSCEKEKTGNNGTHDQGGQPVSFVNTQWSSHLSYVETVSGVSYEFEYDMSMTFNSDSTGLIEQTVTKPFVDRAQFTFTYEFDGISSGTLVQKNMYDEVLEPLTMLYDADEETITLTNDDYTAEQHEKYDQVYHKVK